MTDSSSPWLPEAAERERTVLLTLSTRNGDVAFPVVKADEGPVFFCLGIRKSGSTLLNKTMRFLAQCNGVNIVDIPTTLFLKGIPAHGWADADLSPLIFPQNMYSGFRFLPPGVKGLDAFPTARKVLMYRDPRDSLVSQYFSDAFSHPLPTEAGSSGNGREIFLEKRAKAQAAQIDDYVLVHARVLARTLAEYAPLLDDRNCLSLRYEEHLIQKRRMVAKVLDHFGWTAEPGQIETLMSEVDLIPENEDKERFVRKAIPGDHRQKLRPDTIGELDRILAEVLRRYDYV